MFCVLYILARAWLNGPWKLAAHFVSDRVPAANIDGLCHTDDAQTNESHTVGPTISGIQRVDE